METARFCGGYSAKELERIGEDHLTAEVVKRKLMGSHGYSLLNEVVAALRGEEVRMWRTNRGYEWGGGMLNAWSIPEAKRKLLKWARNKAREEGEALVMIRRQNL